jgi:hypothetical protein
MADLDQDHELLRENGWDWYLEALAFHRDRLTEEESASNHRDAIASARRDYYACAIKILADRIRRQKSN